MSDETNYCRECGRPIKGKKLTVVAIVLLIVFGVVIGEALMFSGQIGSYGNRITDLEYRIRDLEDNVTVLSNGNVRLTQELSHYKLRRPTYEELQSFLAKDGTSERSYVDQSYVCMNFAYDLKASAAEQGWNISFVSVNYDDPRGGGGHACNGAYLADGSWVWIEPQNDRIYTGPIESYLQTFLHVSWVKVESMVIVW
jgi:hypothetical protein